MGFGFANFWATVVSALLTGAFGFYTARLMARTQHQANTTTTQNTENERAWKRADAVEGDADHLREKWQQEFEKRVFADAEIIVLKAQNDKLKIEKDALEAALEKFKQFKP